MGFGQAAPGNKVNGEGDGGFFIQKGSKIAETGW
jgi:hypothetical protein